MPTKIGHFEILSELAKSPTGAVYKANDSQSGQTVALKVIQLSAFGDAAAELQAALEVELENVNALNSPNITSLLGSGEIDGRFCAAMEYVQGNSVATMLARKEGFSIWDLLDIGRQLCAGFDHAASHNIVHYSLEPAKIMCGWDGTVKILGLGLSSVGNFAHRVTEGMPSILYYMSPEQVESKPVDGRSNLFSLAAMFYEMVTERKPFVEDEIESLRQSIVESTPVPPIQVSAKVHPLLSDLIMKALSKDPGARYQRGRDLLDDLEKCKESKPLAAKKPETPKGPAIPDKDKALAQSKFVGSAPATPAKPSAPTAPAAAKSAAAAARPSGAAAPASRPSQTKSVVAKPSESRLAAPKIREAKPSTPAKPASRLVAPKTASAAASVEGTDASPAASEDDVLDLSEQPSPSMSSAAAEPELESFEPQSDHSPKIAVDPMMAEGAQTGSSGISFSEISELPPLQESYLAPPPAPVDQPQPSAPTPAKSTMFQGALKHDQKSKVQPREVAQKAIKEIKSVPPKLLGYALGGAAALILVIGIGVTIYVHVQSGDDSGRARPARSVAQLPVQPAEPKPSQPPTNATTAQAEPGPVANLPEEISPPKARRAEAAATSKSSRRRAAAAGAVMIPGELQIDSTPQGAQVQLDGRSEASYVTPLALTGLRPGQHSITVTKPGYSSDTRSVSVTSGNRAVVAVHLTQLVATLVVKSNPAGANVYVDGHDTGVKTPAQVSVDKGQHVVLVRKMGYIDETMALQFAFGQTFNFAPTLRPLGDADNIKIVGGKMSKLFGGKGAQAGQTKVSIRTQPKGAQVAINQHILDKNSPLDVAVDPGNYVLDITLTGYAPVHKIITADRGGKIVVDEVLERR